jgi:hypothetical protein
MITAQNPHLHAAGAIAAAHLSIGPDGGEQAGVLDQPDPRLRVHSLAVHIGIAAYCRLENKVSLGFVEGLNNKIRVIQRRAYGLRNEDYQGERGQKED